MKYFLSICAIFKNESVGMQEWLEHYIKEGVEHFYLIDNGSTDNYLPIIEKYSHYITLHKDDRKFLQLQHYNNYFMPYKNDSNWVLVVDLDEYVYARLDYKKISNYLQTLAPDIGQVQISWKMFGSNNHIQQPSSIIKSFTTRLYYRHPMVKSIYKCEFLNCIDELHCSNISNGQIIISDGTIINKEKSSKLLHPEYFNIRIYDFSKEVLHLNHYPIQSYEWFKNVKATRGDAYDPNAEYIRDDNYFLTYDKDTTFADLELANKVY
jgi:hypothetical protein